MILQVSDQKRNLHKNSVVEPVFSFWTMYWKLSATGVRDY